MGHRTRDPIAELRGYARALAGDAARRPLPDLPETASGYPLSRAGASRGAPTLIALAAVLVVVVGGGFGIQAANAAVPGETLYGVDLLLEDFLSVVGVDADHTAERFDESAVLLERGDVDGALNAAMAGARASRATTWAPGVQVALVHLQGVGRGDAEAALTALLSAATEAAERPNDPAATDAVVEVTRTVPVAAGHVDLPPGQDPEFVPPGQDPTFVPPGQGDTVPPPGQDPDFVPPGQTDGEKNQDKGNGNGSG